MWVPFSQWHSSPRISCFFIFCPFQRPLPRSFDKMPTVINVEHVVFLWSVNKFSISFMREGFWKVFMKMETLFFFTISFFSVKRMDSQESSFLDRLVTGCVTELEVQRIQDCPTWCKTTGEREEGQEPRGWRFSLGRKEPEGKYITCECSLKHHWADNAEQAWRHLTSHAISFIYMAVSGRKSLKRVRGAGGGCKPCRYFLEEAKLYHRIL